MLIYKELILQHLDIFFFFKYYLMLLFKAKLARKKQARKILFMVITIEIKVRTLGSILLEKRTGEFLKARGRES